ncbi:MAG: hypothetical protein AB1730_14885 [Myxococcota bacterium]
MERKGGSTAVVTAKTVATALTRTATTAREEQALRMRYGARVELDAPLPQAHGGNEELADELLVIEMALLRAVKHRAAQAKAAAKATAPKNATKSKIVGALKSKKK